MIEGKEENLDSISFGRGAVDIQIGQGYTCYKSALHFFSLATPLWTFMTCMHIFTIPSSLSHTCTGVSGNIDCVQHSRFVLQYERLPSKKKKKIIPVYLGTVRLLTHSRLNWRLTT